MKKISIAVADQDSFYLKQLTNYLVKTAQSFEVYSFSRQDSFENFLSGGDIHADILLLSEEMRCAASDAYGADAKILLSEGGQDIPEGYDFVQKYQKSAGLVSEVMLIYGKNSGKGSRLAAGERTTRIIGVYSPVGGSGKTAISLLLAHQLGLRKKKVFYLNCERMDSTHGVLPAEAKTSLSDILVSLHAKETGAGLRIVSGMCTPPRLGFSYVAPLESALEWNEVSLEEQLELLEEISGTGQFDMVVLDFDSEMSADKLRLLELCDQIVVPFLGDSLSLNKLTRLVREIRLRAELAELSKRMIYAANKLAPGMEDYLRRQEIWRTCQPTALVPLSGQWANVGALLQSEMGGSELCAIVNRLCG